MGTRSFSIGAYAGLATLLLYVPPAHSQVAGYDAGKQIISSGLFAEAVGNLNICTTKADLYKCWDAYAPAIVGYIYQKNYKAANTVLKRWKKDEIDLGVVSPCPSDSVVIKKKSYRIGYAQAVYQIAKGLKSPDADKYAIKALLCESWLTGGYKYKTAYNPDKERLGRNNFIATAKRIYGNDPAYDAASFIDDIISKITSTSEVLSGNYDPKNSKKYQTEMAVLFENAAKQSSRAGFSDEYSNFLSSLSQYMIKLTNLD